MNSTWPAWQVGLVAFTLVGLPLLMYLLPLDLGDYNARWAAWAIINVVVIGGLYRWSQRAH